MAPVSCGSMRHQLDERYRPLMVPITSDVVFSQLDTSGVAGKESVVILKSAVINELRQYCGRIVPSPQDIKGWPSSVANRWINLNRPKSSYELGSFHGTLTEGWTFEVVVKVCLDGGQ